jgi:preprotein translocase subunit SecA
MEDALMKPFAGEWVKRILRDLGMKEDEPIKSRMVTRRIETELKKIARSATGDAPANSAEEWLERNCR